MRAFFKAPGFNSGAATSPEADAVRDAYLAQIHTLYAMLATSYIVDGQNGGGEARFQRGLTLAQKARDDALAILGEASRV